MNERFQIFIDDENGHPKLLDNQTGRFYYICDSPRNSSTFADELNLLVRENIDLIKDNQLLRKHNEQLAVELKECQDFRDWVFDQLEKAYDDKRVDI